MINTVPTPGFLLLLLVLLFNTNLMAGRTSRWSEAFELTASGTTPLNAPPVNFGDADLRISPNPFNPVARFSLCRAAGASLKVFASNGRMAADLSAQLTKTPSAAFWNAACEPSGLYIARLTLAGKTRSLCLVLLK